MNKQTISYTLKSLGIKPNYCGYLYLRDAVEMVVEDMDLASSITKILYPTIAKTHKTTPSRVERGIRHAITKAFEERENNDLWERILCRTIKKNEYKPTNGELIAAVADYIFLQEVSEDE